MIKTLVIVAVSVIGLFVFGAKQCSSDSNNQKKTIVVKEIQTPAPQPNPGWKKIGIENGYTMYEPSNQDFTTEWFCVQDWNSTYAIRDCIMQFKKQNGDIVSFKYNCDTRECFLETSLGSGIFATEPWTGYNETGLISTHVRFIKTTDPFNVTVGVKKLSP